MTELHCDVPARVRRADGCPNEAVVQIAPYRCPPDLTLNACLACAPRAVFALMDQGPDADPVNYLVPDIDGWGPRWQTTRDLVTQVVQAAMELKRAGVSIAPPEPFTNTPTLREGWDRPQDGDWASIEVIADTDDRVPNMVTITRTYVIPCEYTNRFLDRQRADLTRDGYIRGGDSDEEHEPMVRDVVVDRLSHGEPAVATPVRGCDVDLPDLDDGFGGTCGQATVALLSGQNDPEVERRVCREHLPRMVAELDLVTERVTVTPLATCEQDAAMTNLMGLVDELRRLQERYQVAVLPWQTVKDPVGGEPR